MVKQNEIGRPLAQIDEKQVLKLAKLQCTHEEIAAFFDVDRSTITKRFSQILTKGYELGKMSLRRSQFALAKKSPAMAIWLGKQYLGQAEKIEVRNDEIVNEDLKFEKVPTGGNGKFKRFYN